MKHKIFLIKLHFFEGAFTLTLHFFEDEFTKTQPFERINCQIFRFLLYFFVDAC